jgi:NitT/TauT family transport system substrate-binding protein
MNNWHVLIITLLVFLLPAGCSSEKLKKKTETVTLQLKWLHQSQFAGYYMAKAKGYYAEEALDVVFIEGGNDVDLLKSLSSKKANFAIMSADSIIKWYSEGNDVKAISVLFQRSPLVFVAKTASRIHRPQDFIGKTIAVGDTEGGGFEEATIQFKAMMKRMNLDPDQSVIVPYAPDYEEFLAGKVDITPAYVLNGVQRLRSKGLQLNLIWPNDYGINFYSDTLATTSAFLEKNHDIAERFLRASLKGWRYAIEHTDESVEVALAYTENKDRAFQMRMFESLLPLVHTGEQPIGWIEPKIWQEMHDTLVEQGVLAAPTANVHNSYSPDILYKIYGKSPHR